jgi:solute carrier family 45, member 1/2/4
VLSSPLHYTVFGFIMTVPVLASSDPDPSFQLPWPRKNRTQNEVDVIAEPSVQEQGEDPPNRQDPTNKPPSYAEQPGRRRLSTWDLFTLSVAMAGAQVAWTVELG